MSSDELARPESLWLEIRDLDDYDMTIRRIASVLAEARLDEAKWWQAQFSAELMSEPEFIRRIAELEAAVQESGK